MHNLTYVDDLSTQKRKTPSCSAISKNDVSEWRSSEDARGDLLIGYWLIESMIDYSNVVDLFVFCVAPAILERLLILRSMDASLMYMYQIGENDEEMIQISVKTRSQNRRRRNYRIERHDVKIEQAFLL